VRPLRQKFLEKKDKKDTEFFPRSELKSKPIPGVGKKEDSGKGEAGIRTRKGGGRPLATTSLTKGKRHSTMRPSLLFNQDSGRLRNEKKETLEREKPKRRGPGQSCGLTRGSNLEHASNALRLLRDGPGDYIQT